jgi:hypothetical protein
MDVWVVNEAASGYCVGAFTTEKAAQIAAEVRDRDGYPCNVSMVLMNKDTDDERA